MTSLPVVVLEDDGGQRQVTVSVGLSEASAIAAELDGIELERPMTHQLACSLLECAGATVEHIEITGRDGGVFRAAVHLTCAGGGRRIQDARPSDALALALHVGAEVRVATDLMEPTVMAEGTSPSMAVPLVLEPGQSDANLDGLDEAAFGKWKM